MLAEMAHARPRHHPHFGEPSSALQLSHKGYVGSALNGVGAAERYSQQQQQQAADGTRRPKKIVFFCNGNRYFKGKKLYITPHRYVTFNDLLSDLTGKLPSSSSLPYGVRQIYTPSGGRKIREIDELQDGKSYVCAGFETFKTIKYGHVDIEPWATGRPSQRHGELPHLEAKLLSGFSAVFGKSTYAHRQVHAAAAPAAPAAALQPAAAAAAHRPQLSHLDPYVSPRAAAAAEDRLTQALTSQPSQAGRAAPAAVTIVRAGIKPYSVVKLLLNRSSLQSYESLLSDVSEAFGPKWKHNRVRRLYALSGREVLSLSDFLRGGDGVFVAVGGEKATLADIQDIIEELFGSAGSAIGNGDVSQAKSVLRSLEKRKKKVSKQRELLDSLVEEEQQQLHTTATAAADSAERQAADRRLLPPLTKVEHDQQRQHAQAAAADAREQRIPLQQVQLPVIDRMTIGAEEPKQPQQKPHFRVKPSPREAAAALLSKLGEPAEARLTINEKQPLPSIQPDANKASQVIPTVAVQPVDGATETVELKSKARAQQEKRSKEERVRQSLYRSVEAKMKEDGLVGGLNGPPDSPGNDGNDKIAQVALATHGGDEEPSYQKPAAKRKDRRAAEPRLAKSRSERQTTVEQVYDAFEIGAALGDGNFAVVHECASKRNQSETYAIKIIDKAKLAGKEAMLENEIAIMKACNDSHLVKLLDEFETENAIFLLMELVKGGDLFDAISQSVKFDERTSAKMTRDIALGLFYLHSRNIVHRDLKPENCMVVRQTDGSISLKLGDFGLATEVHETLYTVCGTPTYVAPEILSEVGYGLEVDLWALGVIVYILLCGFPPFRSAQRNQSELFENIKAGHYDFRSPYWDDVSAGAKDLIERLLIVDRKKRYTAADVLCHPWVLTEGGTLSLPLPIEQHSNNTRNRLLTKAAENMAEWQSHRVKVFAHLSG